MKFKRSELIKEAETAGQEVHDYISRLVREEPGIEIEDDTREL